MSLLTLWSSLRKNERRGVRTVLRKGSQSLLDTSFDRTLPVSNYSKRQIASKASPPFPLPHLPSYLPLSTPSKEWFWLRWKKSQKQQTLRINLECLLAPEKITNWIWRNLKDMCLNSCTRFSVFTTKATCPQDINWRDFINHSLKFWKFLRPPNHCQWEFASCSSRRKLQSSRFSWICMLIIFISHSYRWKTRWLQWTTSGHRRKIVPFLC